MKTVTTMLGFYASIWGVSEFTGSNGEPTWEILLGLLAGAACWQGGKFWLRNKYPATFAKRSPA